MAQANPLLQTDFARAYVDFSPDFEIDQKLFSELQNQLESDERTAELGFVQGARVPDLFDSDTAYRRYLSYYYADHLAKNPHLTSPDNALAATEYLQGLSDVGGTRAEALENYRNRIRLYQGPSLNIQPLQRRAFKDEYDRFKQRIFDPSVPPKGDDFTRTDYSPTSGINRMSEEERQEFADNNINPDRYFNAGQSYQEQYITGLKNIPADDTINVLGATIPIEPLRPLRGLKKQLIFNRDMPWRLKLFAGGAFNPTPEEAEFAMADEFPDIKGRIRYLFPLQPDRGLGVLVPKQDDSGEMEIIPLRPEAGLEEILDVTAELTMQETTPILLELSRGGLKNTANRIGNAVRRVLGKEEKAKKHVPVGGMKRAIGNAAMVAAEASLGRVIQLSAARQAEVNNLSFERMLDDANMAAVLAGLGSLGVSATLGTLGIIHNAFFGKDIPAETLEKLAGAVEELKLRRADKDFPVEFTNEDLKQIAAEAGESIGKEANLVFTLGQLTGKDDILKLESELYNFLQNRNFPETRVFEEAIYNNREVAATFWQALTKQTDTDITAEQFVKTLQARQEEIQKLAQRAAQKEISLLKKEAAIPSTVISKYRILEDESVDDLAEIFTRKSGPGYQIYRSSPVILKQADDEYAKRVSTFEDAVQGLADIEVDPTIVQQAFKDLRSRGGADRILKLLGNVRLAEAIREITPMGEGGVSTLKRLAGEKQVTEAGETVEPITYDVPTLFSIKEAVESLLGNSGDKGLQAAAIRFRNTIDEQIESTLNSAAKTDLEAQGINPTPALIEQYRRTGERFTDYNRARKQLFAYQDSFDRDYIKTLAAQTPEEVLPFILNSNPRQLNNYIDLVNMSPDSESKLASLRKLVIKDIEGVVNPSDDLATQNKQWAEYLDKNEKQLEALFPEADFLELKDWSKVLGTAQADALEIQQNLDKVTEALGLDVDFTDFIKRLFGTSADERITDADLIKLEKLGDILKQYPGAQQQAYQVFRGALKRKFESFKAGLEKAGSPGEESTQGDVFDLNAFKSFIDSGFASGQTGQDQLAKRLIPIFGKDVGREYARDLRAFAFLVQKQDAATADKVLQKTQGNSRQTAGEWQGIISSLQRIFVPVLSQASRRITYANELLRLKAQADLLDVVTNPDSLKKYIKSRNRKFTAKEYLEFLGGLTAAREVDIGTGRGEQPFEQKLGVLGGFGTAVGTRIDDLLEDEDEDEL